MKLSIVTICRNDAAGLARTLSSTFESQPGFPDWEQIVVDGASTDGSFAEVDRHRGDPRLGWCVSEPDKGIYNAMNKGAAHARGDYLLFLNAGDILKPDVLKDVFRDDPSEDILYGDVDISTGGVAKPRVSPELAELTPGWFLFDSLPHQGCFISKSLHDRIGGYDETFRISAAPAFVFRAVFEEKATLRRLPIRVSEFDRSGISSQPKFFDAKMKEWERFLVPYFGKRVVATAQRGLANQRFVRPASTAFVRKNWELENELLSLTDWFVDRNKKDGLAAEKAERSVDCVLAFERSHRVPAETALESAGWLFAQKRARGVSLGQIKRGAELFLDLRSTRKGRILLRVIGRLCGRRPL